MPQIRIARPEDATRLLEIYGHYVENTAVTYEYVTPTVPEFQSRITNTLAHYPYLVVVQDGVVLGYAYAGPLVARAAADWACEVSIYLDRNAHGLGLGRLLYTALEQALARMGIVNLYAVIAWPEKPDEYLSTNSADFHAHLGYREAGHLHHCGYKFGRWYDLIWMEKVIGKHRDKQSPITPYPDTQSP